MKEFLLSLHRFEDGSNHRSTECTVEGEWTNIPDCVAGKEIR